MGEELVTGKGFNLDRREMGDRDFLLSIKHGEWDYDDIMKICNTKKEFIEKHISISNLPDKVEENMINDLLIEMRRPQLQAYITGLTYDRFVADIGSEDWF